jgi:hypothetical protein
MKATIELSKDYFGRKWQLVLHPEGQKPKKLYLGQDIKVCQRLLGMDQDEVLKKLNTRDFITEESLEKLASLILDHLSLHYELSPEKCLVLDHWALSVE